MEANAMSVQDSATSIELGQAIAIGLSTVVTGFSIYLTKLLRTVQGTADQVNCAVNQSAPGEGLKDRLARVETSLAAAATVNADHQAETNRQFDSLHESMAEINQVVVHMSSRLVVVEDDQAQARYVGAERRAKPVAAKRVPPRKAGAK